MSSSCSSAFGHGWTYDVFLSFRGDTRKKFTDHLYTSLKQAGIHTFRDDEELPKGDEISQNLRDAIRKSRISIVVFSKGYASSRWCLNELVEILECKHEMEGYTVLPIFYDIDPSDIRKQTGSYAEAFVKHEERFREEMEKVDKWRAALTEAGNLSGWGLKDEANGYESEFIRKIVEYVSNKLDRKHLYVAKYPVGIDTRVEDIIAMLSIDTNDVQVVGIYGMAGIGKTTIAKAVFNQLCNRFIGSSFLLNVKENGSVQLQEQLLRDTLKQDVLKIDNEDRGIILIKERLCYKRVLIVVDDVDQSKQLDVLVGERSWFGPGSRIIITTRDERLLTQFDANERYLVKELYQEDSFELLSWHAFKNKDPMDDFEELSMAVVKYAKGLPLALEVLGGSLYKRSKLEWESIIEKLSKIPPQDVQGKLKISFETLDDGELKDIFLDIACFFVGWDEEYVEIILDARGFSSVIGIRRLIERSLITKNHQNNQLEMHDLIRAMGREIIRGRSPNNVGNRSRIWFREDALSVLKQHMGTEIVEGITLDVRAAEGVSLSTESFTNMRHLKLLQINGVHLSGCYKNLSKELIWLCWLECPLESLSSNFQLDNITIIDMQHSNLKELWKETKETKYLNKLKILNLSYSDSLTKTPNFAGLSGLERLIFEDCTSLIEVHQSIGCLIRLVSLNLKGCCRLKNLPRSICNLKSLETLDITMCSQVKDLPVHLGEMESLSELLAGGTAITQLPSSIGNLKNLKSLSLRGCNYKQGSPSTSWLSSFSSWLSPRSSNSEALLPASFVGLTSFTNLDLSFCGLDDCSFSNVHFGNLTHLRDLNLSGNFFFNLPSGINDLGNLSNFVVEECPNLQSIPGVPLWLSRLTADNCTSMERLSVQSKTKVELSVNGCQNLIEIQGLKGHLDISSFNCDNLSKEIQNMQLQALCMSGIYCNIILGGGEIPKCFSHQVEGSSLSFKVPQASDGIPEALVIWVVYSGQNEESSYSGIDFVSAVLKNKSNGKTLFKELMEIAKCKASFSSVMHVPLTDSHHRKKMEGIKELELCFELEFYRDSKTIKTIDKCGVHLIVKKPDDHEKWNVDGQGTTVVPYQYQSNDFASTSSGDDEHEWIKCFRRELQGRDINKIVNFGAE